MFNWQIIGHQKITHFLENAIQNDALNHAYLFYGPKQVGKKTLVKRFILSLMCYTDNPHKSQIPCEVCNQCQQIKKNVHPDVFWIEKENDKKDITVEQIRELRHKLSRYSFFKSYKIAIIKDAEQMNLASANALLKTLEEPAKRTILILISQNIERIPKTVLSRVQKIKLLPVPTKEIFDYLIKQGEDRMRAKYVASVAAGRPGRALAFLHNKELWQAYLMQLRNFFLLVKSSRTNRLKFAEKFLSGKHTLTLVQKNAMLIPFLNLCQLIIRDLMLYKINQSDNIINVAAIDDFNQISGKYSLANLINLEKNIDLTKKYLQMNVNPRLALENLLLSF